MMRAAWLLLLVLGVSSGVGCGDDPARGGAGESCTRRDDCGAGLRCVSQVCVASPDGGTTGVTSTSGEGGACSARAQCAPGLLCADGTCIAASGGLEANGRSSGVGESCRATSDCMGDLACMTGLCARVAISLDRTDKQCHRIECAQDADCCEAFVPDANCAAYQQNCETDPVFCNTYRSLCECSRRCEEELCVVAAPGCEDDGECTSQQTPFCVEGSCRQCQSDGNCPGEGTQCVQGVCMAGCTLDEQCPALHECKAGECVEVGCATDRECVFLTGDVASICDTSGMCRTPCVRDVDCGDQTEHFQVCTAGQCTFVGCENDAECRALLQLNGQTGIARAVCR